MTTISTQRRPPLASAKFGVQPLQVKSDHDYGEAIRKAVKCGLGGGPLLRSQVAADLEDGKLVQVLDDWVTELSGFNLFHPSRPKISPAAFIDHIEEAGKPGT